MPASLASRPVAAFPVEQAGRLPHYWFRGLHSVQNLAARMVTEPPKATLWRRSASDDVVTSTIALRLLPAGATVAGRDSHPLRSSAFSRRTVQRQLLLPLGDDYFCRFRSGRTLALPDRDRDPIRRSCVTAPSGARRRGRQGGRQLGSLVPITDTGEWTPTSLPPVYDRGPGRASRRRVAAVPASAFPSVDPNVTAPRSTTGGPGGEPQGESLPFPRQRSVSGPQRHCPRSTTGGPGGRAARRVAAVPASAFRIGLLWPHRAVLVKLSSAVG